MGFESWVKEAFQFPINDKGIAMLKTAYEAGFEHGIKTRVKQKTKAFKAELGEYTQLFEDVWKAYPKRIGKGGAFAIWKRLIKSNDELFLRNRILAALEWQVQSKSWKDGYIPNPETYLNQRRWEDESPIEATKNAPCKEMYQDITGVWRTK